MISFGCAHYRKVFALAVLAFAAWTLYTVVSGLSPLVLLALSGFVIYGLRFAHQLGVSSAEQRTEGRVMMSMSLALEDAERALAEEQEVVAAFMSTLQPEQF
jgi:hypothetical protein